MNSEERSVSTASGEHRHEALVRALDAIAGIDGVPHCLLPLLGGQTFCVPVQSSPPSAGKGAMPGCENPDLKVYTDAGLRTGKIDVGGCRDMSMPGLLQRVETEGWRGLVIDSGLPRRLFIRGNDLVALRSELEKMKKMNAGSETVDCASGSEMVIATPDPAPSAALLQTLKKALRTGGTFRRAWLFETILPGSTAGELCIGVEPLRETDGDLLEERVGTVIQAHAAELAGRKSVAFLMLQGSDFVDVVQSVGILLDDGVGK
ncbi:MAG TPA: hypothetical protein PKM25_01400 [Candidatus Ozemobacteraceae bacterium]|nr:hypothetical protein [Candidatus Ozemobacteraceae bacterium]